MGKTMKAEDRRGRGGAEKVRS